MQYWHWLLIASLTFAVLERVRPARRAQGFLRTELAVDLFYLALHGNLWWLLFGGAIQWSAKSTSGALGLPEGAALLGQVPWGLQLALFLIVADFLQWCVHNLLHRVPFLWQFHKVHHSAHAMDWAVNFRFHWVETIVYRTLLFVPLACLGGEPSALFAAAVFGTFWGHFNHSNLDVSLGPLGYIFNSPCMHMWHHDASTEGGVAKNYGIILSVWDFAFGTAYWPRERAPQRLGYAGDDDMPSGLLGQLAFPLARNKSGEHEQPD